MKYTKHKVGIRGIFLVLCALQAALPGAAAAQAFGTTTVQGTVYTAGGAPASGTLQLSWPAFTTAASQAVAAGRTSVSIGSDGFVSVNLAPNLGASPAGLYYTAVYHLSDGTTSTEYWVVPAASQATLAQVRAQVMPAAQAVQAVNKAYVDQSIAQITQSQITPLGGTFNGPLYLSADPSMPTQAATKHYVDNQVSQTLSINGGAATGPLTAVQLGAAYQADQFAGSDFGSKLQACINALNATYGGSCDARNFTGTLSMGSNVTIATGNVTIDLPCATIATSNQIIVTAGTRNATLHGCASRGTSAASGNQGGTVFLYSGNTAMMQVGDATYASDTLGFHLDNVVINTTSATAATAQAISIWRGQELHLEGLYLLGNANQTGISLDGTGNYTGGTLQDVELTGFQIAVNAIGHQITNGATTDWVNASTFVRLHIDCPMANGDAIAGTTGINLAQGDGNTFTGGDVEGCATALHLGPNAQNNTIVGLRNENSTYQVVADAGSAYNNWMTGGTMFTGKLTDNGTRNSFFDTFHRSFNALNGDWYGSQQDATLTNHYRLGIGSGNERGLLHRYQTDSGYRWTMGLSDATAGAQYYQVLDELNNVYRLSIGQYNTGQSSSNNQTVINAAGTGAVVLNGSNNAGSGGVVFGSGGSSSATVATVDNAGNAQFNGTLRVGGVTTFSGSSTIKNQADAEIDAFLWAGATAPQKESVVYKDWNGNSQWYMVKDASNNWALNSAVGGVDSFKAYQSNNSGDTYVDAANNTGTVRVNYEPGSGSAFNIYGGNSSSLYASFNGTTGIKFPGLAAGSGHNCVQIDNSGYLSNTGSACSGSNVGTGTAGQIAYYPGNGSSLAGMSAIPIGSGGTGATTAAGALATLGGLALSGGAMQGMITLSGDPTLPLHPATKQYTDASVAAAQAQAGSANAAASAAQSTANNALPANGCTSTPGGNVTCPGVVKVRSTISGDLPLLDIRHPSFAGGAVCDGATDIGPALQVAVNALPSQGGEILIPGSPTPCYWANPTTFNWGTHSGQILLFVQGLLRTGTTLALTSLSTSVSIIGKAGYGFASFQAPGEPAAIFARPINNVPAIGTLGTAVTSTLVPTTVTLSSMNGIFPGTAIDVVGQLTCTTATTNRTSKVVTATFSSGCHIPPGVILTVAGCADSTYNGAYAGGAIPQQFLSTGSDYVANTMSWNNTGSNGSTTGCTVTGMNEDTIETVQITATTGTTATATFARPHNATDQFGMVGMTLGGSTGAVARVVKDIQVIGDGLDIWMQQDYLTRLINVGATATQACGGNLTNFPVEIEYSSFITMDGVAFNAGCIPWSVRLTEAQALGYTGSGPINISNSFIMAGIKADHGGSGITLKNVVDEQTVRGIVTFDPTNYNTYNGNVSDIIIEQTGEQDNPNGIKNCFVYYEYPALGGYGNSNGASNVILKQLGSESCMVNDYFSGGLSLDTPNFPAQYGRIKANGVKGVYNDGKTVEAELRGEQAGFSPTVIPYASLPVQTNPASWSGGACTVTAGVLAPDGSNTAGAIACTSASGFPVETYSVTPAVGDAILYGGWVYTPTAGQQTISSAFTVDNFGSTHFSFFPTASGSGSDSTVRYDSGIISDWWHPVVGLATITAADGTAGAIRMSIGADQNRTMEYWQPFMIYIPASANVPLAELNRYRQQLLHGAVPSNYNGPGVPATVDAIATGGYDLVNPSGGAPIPVLPSSVVTGYSTDGGTNTGDTVAIAKGRFTKSNAGVCPNGTNGELTTSGCANTLLPATTTALGGVKCDGTTTTCAADGTISASLYGSGVLTTAGGQTISAANTVSGLPSGCQQLPCLVSSVPRAGLTANVTNTTAYVVPNSQGGSYLVSCYESVTTAATTSSTLPQCEVTYTDEDTGAAARDSSGSGNVRVGSTSTQNIAGATNFNGSTPANSIVIHAAASSTIYYNTGQGSGGYVSTGATAMAYALHFTVVYMGP